jgi:cobalamin biosynthesis Mg chelatase CobN
MSSRPQTSRVRALTAAALLAIFALPAAALADSGAEQYIEQVPGADGKEHSSSGSEATSARHSTSTYSNAYASGGSVAPTTASNGSSASSKKHGSRRQSKHGKGSKSKDKKSQTASGEPIRATLADDSGSGINFLTIALAAFALLLVSLVVLRLRQLRRPRSSSVSP